MFERIFQALFSYRPVIFQQGDEGSSLFIIEDGEVEPEVACMLDHRLLLDASSKGET